MNAVIIETGESTQNAERNRDNTDDSQGKGTPHIEFPSIYDVYIIVVLVLVVINEFISLGYDRAHINVVFRLESARYAC